VRARLQFLTLDQSPYSHAEQARFALEGGVKWIQLRTKNLSEKDWIKTAIEVGNLCRDFGATFMVNDSPRVALAAEADGVHLGPKDVSPQSARALLGEFAIVGVTLNTLDHLSILSTARIDYAGVGPVRYTTSKELLAPVHSDKSLQELIQGARPVPCYAIGGVRAEDWENLQRLGAHGFAVSSAIALSPDPLKSARDLVYLVSA
jgi:thiamine-phosphate pyrophosphorylase